jgi:excisionase family DNA binding protein
MLNNQHHHLDSDEDDVKSLLENLSYQLEEEGKKRAVALTYFTVTEACKMLKVCRKTLYNYRNEGQLRFVKIGRKVLIKAIDIEAFINAYRL